MSVSHRPVLLLAALVTGIVLALLVAFLSGRLFLSLREAGSSPSADTPPRIVSLAPAATECLFHLGLGPYVVGRSPYCDTPPEAKSLPVVGDLLTFDESAMARLAPTHAIVSTPDHPAIPFLSAMGATSIVVRTRTDAEVIGFMRSLGELFPTRTNGVFDAWLNEIRAVDGRCAGTVRVALILDTDAGPRMECMVAGHDSYYDDLLRQVGLVNIYAEREGFTPLSPEVLLRDAPDILFVVCFARDPAVVADEWGGWMGGGVRTVVLSEPWAYRPGVQMARLKRAFLDAALAAAPEGEGTGGEADR